MKKRKCSLLRRMLAVLLAAVLVVGMTSNAAPISVLAAEAGNIDSGDGWVLTTDGKLTISSDKGMENWIKNRPRYYKKIENVEILNGVESIGIQAFDSCENLASISIPSSVTSIGWLAFSTCKSLTSISIPSSVTSIENSAFYCCSKLEGISIPSSVTSIGDNTFYGCSSLTKITIPKKVGSIGDKAFNGCSKLANVTMERETPPTIGDNVFIGCEFYKNQAKGILVPEGKAQAYKNEWTNWAKYITDGMHEHSWSSDWEHNETYHWHKCTISGCPMTDNAGKDGYGEHIYNNDSDNECNKCGYIRTLPDTQPPTGKIEIDGNLWNTYLQKITFELFFKEAKQVTITANDTGSGVDKIYYHVSDRGLTEAEVEALEDKYWTEWKSFSISPERKCVIYAKITDKAKNVTYLSSNGLVFDGTAPVITGVKDGETYNESQTVTVTDNTNLESVTVNGAAVTLNDNNKFTLGTADGSQTIIAKDKAGNTATVTVTIKVQSHTCIPQLVEKKKPGCTIVGKQAYYNCKVCGKNYEDEKGTTPIDDISVWGNIGTLGHSWEDWTVTQPAMETTSGQRERTCKRCGQKETETIPATGAESGTRNETITQEVNSGTGNVTPEVKSGVIVPVTNISTPIEELKDMLLTNEERKQVQNGTNISIVLEVKDAGNAVSNPDKVAIQQALNGFTVGQYLNIDLYKLVGTDRTDITETAKKVRIVITIPDSLKNTSSSNTRTFNVIRVHNGSAELLPDLDDNADTITIETDRFSTYAVVYKDTASSGSGNNGGGNDNGNNGNDNGSQNNSDQNDAKPDSTKDNEPKTGDTTPLELYATLAMIAGFAYLLMYFEDQKMGMTEETKRELISRIIGWAKRGGRIRKCLAIAAVFALLVYYHSIGKKTCAEWKEIYGE